MKLFYTKVLCEDGQARIVEAGTLEVMDTLLESLLPYFEVEKWSKEVEQGEYKKMLEAQNKDRMLDLEIMWQDFDCLPLDDNEKLTDNFEQFPMGTPKNEIVEWFDQHYIGGLKKLFEELEK